MSLNINFWVCLRNPKVWPFKRKPPSSIFLHSNESCQAILSCGVVFYAVEGGSNFWACRWNPRMWPFKWKLLSSTFLWCCLLCCTRWFSLLSLWMKSWSLTVLTNWYPYNYFKVNTDKSMLQTNLMLYRLSSVAEPEESQRSSFLGPESLQFSISQLHFLTTWKAS